MWHDTLWILDPDIAICSPIFFQVMTGTDMLICMVRHKNYWAEREKQAFLKRGKKIGPIHVQNLYMTANQNANFSQDNIILDGKFVV